MNSDPSRNVFVFEVQINGTQRRFGGHAPTRDSACLRKVWAELAPQAGITPLSVQRLYSEWELSQEDIEFAHSTFAHAALSYSFSRPKDNEWDTAMEEASRTMQDAAIKKASALSRPKRWWQFWK
jgi:hypothetical protein